MKIKTSELEGAALDWAVAEVIGASDMRTYPGEKCFHCIVEDKTMIASFSPSTDWTQGGPLLSEFAVSVRPITDASWQAEEFVTHCTAIAVDKPGCCGYLIAAMRAIVAAELGDEVDVPEELA